jgi:hypothetical protein
MRSKICLAIAVTAMVALGWLRSYEVTPSQAGWSGWAPSNGYVGETFIANFDSLTEVSLFTGILGSGANYRLDVYDAETNARVAYQYDVAPVGDHTWLRFTSITPDGKFVRGRSYIGKFTRPNDSINWYKDINNRYHYGSMVRGGTGLQPPEYNDDLCARIYGKARVGDEFSVQSVVAWSNGQGSPRDTAGWADLVESEVALGVKSDKLGYNFDHWYNTGSGVYKTDIMDSLVGLFASAGIRTPVHVGPGTWARSGWDESSIARGLFEGVLNSSGQINDSNLLARFIYDFAHRYGPHGDFWQSHQGLPIDLYETPAEPTTHYALGRGYSDGYWQLSNLTYAPYRETLQNHIQLHNDSPDSVYLGRKSSFMHVYARYVIVQDSALKLAAQSLFVPEESLPRNAAYCVTMAPWNSGQDSSLEEHFYPGEWLDGYRRYGVGPFFDVASYHPYGRKVADQEALLRDTFRYYFRSGGWFSPRPFWISEVGYFGEPNGEDDPTWPVKLLESYATIQHANAIPGYPVEQLTWFAYTQRYLGDDYDSTYDSTAQRWVYRRTAAGITDLEFQPRTAGHAYKQWSELCRGASFEGRTPTSGLDNNPDETLWVHAYQYRDSLGKRFWLAWEDLGWPYQARTFTAPARADTESGCGVDTGGSFNVWVGPAAPSGWFAKEFDTFPVIVFEGQNFSRPDIVVDSVRMVPPTLGIGLLATAHVYFHNAGSDTTPDWPAGHHYTYVILRHNGDSVAQALYDSQLPPGGTGSVSISVSSVPASWHGTGLFDATANYGQEYVELNGMDDNDGYSRNRIKWLAEVDSPYVVCGSHHNEPVVLLGLRTYSKERDTTGQTPCDSARLVQWWYGLNDTVVHAGDTTAWFCVNQSTTFDTSWQFLFGQGKYKLLVQAKDSWSESELIPDGAHPYVFFDTTGPTGSIVINGGARFTASSTCTLRLSAQDSLSSVAGMRLLNLPPANLVSDGGFVGNGGSWTYENGGYDDSLGLGWLTAAPPQATVTQFIPAESISAHAGDSCVLEASILAHVHGDDAVGSVAFWYLSTNVNPEITDTLWQLVDSAGFSGNLLSLTGRYGLSKHFLLTTPAPDTNWVWQGGMVRAKASAENGNGTVYVDNAALIPYEVGSSYAWWADYDTLVEWSIGSGAGPHTVRALFIDSAGNHNATPCADTVILDPRPPVVDISLPMIGQLVNGVVDVTGVAYDTVEVPGDSWFSARRLWYRSADSTNWLPVSPDSVSHQAALPDSMSSQGPAVHLGNWNTLPLPDGPYYLLLTACDSAGNTSSCTTWVMVDHGFGGGGMRCGPEGGASGMGEGSVYVGSSTGTVLHLGDDLDSLDAFSVNDSGSQANITAIVEVGEDSILVLDAHNKRVHKLHRSGQHRRRLVSGLSQPTDLKRDSSGNFWLVDRGWNRIGKFRSNGTLVFVRGGLGADSLHFHSPEGIAVKGGLVYVADGGNNRIAVWDTSGHFKTTITGDFENPTAVYVSDAGAIYLTDGTDGKLKGITPLGGNIVSIGTTDSSKLKGLVPSENRHSLFSLASGPNKVYKLRIQSDESRPGGAQSGGRVNLPKTLALNQPFPNPARTRLNIAYALPRQTRVELKLYDVAGKLVTTMASGEQKPGYYNLTWNRQDTKGRTCACGIYFCTLSAEGKRFSRKVILTE